MSRMRNIFSGILIAVFTIILNGCGQWAYKKEIPDKLEIINEIIKEETPVLDGTPIYNPDIIAQLYEKSESLLSGIWGNKENIDQMLYAIRNADLEGLRSEDYHLSVIEKLVQKIIQSDSVEVIDIAKLEVLLTDAFLVLSTHLSEGKTDAVKIDPKWRALKRFVRGDLGKFIDSTLQDARIVENLHKITPRHREYNNLKKALVIYRQLDEKGGWKTFNTTLIKLEKGLWHTDVAQLRNRLAITEGFIENEIEDKYLFDIPLYEQVLLFQIRNGLTADGVVGKATIEAMNIPIEDRIASIEANLERWRWLSANLGQRYIKVNIANFELQVIENDSMVFQTDAIVGRTLRETPVFSSLMKYLVLNPDWTVPPTIQNDDIIPSVIRNPAYLSEKNMKILSSDGKEVDPLTIDWLNVDIAGFPYSIHQAPGPKNALGRVKFMFPNKYSVYIHDTPSRYLFAFTDRSFSSGCIRINNPMALAAWLLKDNPALTLEYLKNVVELGLERVLFLAKPIQVHVLYLTAWSNDRGIVYFRKDVYNRDQPLLTALRQCPPETIQ